MRQRAMAATPMRLEKPAKDGDRRLISIIIRP
jgi:hypothetical protein